MAKFDEDEDEIFNIIKSDLVTIDSTIEELIKEAQARSKTMGELPYHDLSAPLTKLLATKQKSMGQLLKMLETIKNETSDEVELDIDHMYSNFEPQKEEIK